MQKREPGNITVYDDGVVIYLGIIKEESVVELEITTVAAERLIEELISRVQLMRKTITMHKERSTT